MGWLDDTAKDLSVTGDTGSSISDPAGIFGVKNAKNKKKQDEQNAQTKADQLAAQKQFMEDYKNDVNLNSTDDISAQQFAGGQHGINKYKTSLSVANADVGYLRGLAQSSDMTEGAKRQIALQKLQEQSGIEQAKNAQSSQTAQNFSNLAQQGGAGAGARERLFNQAGTQSIREQQAARRSGALARLGIGSQDEANKLQLASNLPTQQLAISSEQRAGLTADQAAALTAAQANQKSQLVQNQANFESQQNLYKLKAGILGGNQVADAQANVGVGGQSLFNFKS